VTQSTQILLLVAPILLFSMVAHEYAHGYAAFRQGDDTAHAMGRLSWNPLRHIDPFMTVLLPLFLVLTHAPFIFGGAKPVPVDPRKYRNYRSGDIIVSLAGIVTNLVIAALLLPAILALGVVGRALPIANDTLSLLQVMFMFGIMINVVLAGFNLIPVPPLDGSHVLKHLLPTRWALGYARVSRAGLLLIVVLLTIGRPLFDAWMTPFMALIRVAWMQAFPHLLASPWVDMMMAWLGGAK
jgi:Zn-dependent protease